MMKFDRREEICLALNRIDRRIAQALEFNQYFLQPSEKKDPFAAYLVRFKSDDLLKGAQLLTTRQQIRDILAKARAD